MMVKWLDLSQRSLTVQMSLAFNGKNIAKHFSALIQINIQTWKKGQRSNITFQLYFFQSKMINLLIHYQNSFKIIPQIMRSQALKSLFTLFTQVDFQNSLIEVKVHIHLSGLQSSKWSNWVRKSL